ncbi:MAG TPA: hypothetical protein VIO64_03540 [Pseudobacteroides sp.]|uniref:hypothetical protein n=1 Tax=Pseudobacteroides sp. TaxID=1968840 RepID=UPI002F932649
MKAVIIVILVLFIIGLLLFIKDLEITGKIVANAVVIVVVMDVIVADETVVLKK